MSKLRVISRGVFWQKEHQMVYGYIRVSTHYQLKGNSVEDQKENITKYYPSAELYIESESGKNMDRPIFKRIMNQLKKDDIFVVTKLDRFCRSTQEGLEYIKKLQEIDCKIHILNMGLIENTAIGKLIITNILAYAEFERNIILERTLAGKEIARRKKGFTEGRPRKYTTKQLEHATQMLQLHTYREVEELTGISKSTLKRHLMRCQHNKFHDSKS